MIRQAVKSATRKLLGQERQVRVFGSLAYIALRRDAWRQDSGLLDLERQLEESDGVVWARAVPEIDRLVIQLAEPRLPLAPLLERIILWERAAGLGRSRFPVHDRFPASSLNALRTVSELAADTGGLGLGIFLGRLGQSRFGFWMDVSALVSLVDTIPELRDPLEQRLGQENAELIVSIATSFSDAMMRGWSGATLDMVHRLHELRALASQRESWVAQQEALSVLWRDMRQTHLTVSQSQGRAHPVPAGAVERYQATAEKLALAGFGVGMAATHSLSQSVGNIFISNPKPALLGRDSFVIELARQLSRHQVLVLEQRSLSLLDRVSCVVLDGSLLERHRRCLVAELPLALDAAALRSVAGQLLENEVFQVLDGETYRLEEPGRKRLPARIGRWMNDHGATHDQVRLVYRGDTLAGAVLIHSVVDPLVETMVSRIRSAGVKLIVASEHDHYGWARPDHLVNQASWPSLREDLQARGDVVLVASDNSGFLDGADIALGLTGGDSLWPGGCHLVAGDWARGLWLLLDACERARRAARQSVELSRIEAFSGLVMSLRDMAPSTISRIKTAANASALLAMANGIRLAQGLSPLPDNLHGDPVPWHAMDVSDVLHRLETSLEGLGLEQVAQRLQGSSEERAQPVERFSRVIWQELANPLAPVLAAGAGLAALTGALGDAALIGLVVGMNAVIGGVQRYRTENRIAAMERREQRTVRCLRNGLEHDLDSADLVPGDVIHLQAGEVVPADARVLAQTSLEMDESSLTGESLPVRKHAAACYAAALAERQSMLFQGCTVAAGEAHAVIVSRPEGSEAMRGTYVQRGNGQQSGVEARLDSLTEMTAPVAAFAGVSVMIAGLSRNQPVADVIGAGVSLTVAAVPEGLPLMATMAQLASSGRLANNGALVRNPRAVEALGRMNVLCADKTGTLTEGTLKLQALAVDGELVPLDRLSAPARVVLVNGLLASPDHSNGDLVHMTDQAVVNAARGHAPEVLEELGSWQRLDELPFRSERGYHATLVSKGDERQLMVKGAPDVIVPLCERWQLPDGTENALDQKARTELNERAESLARSGYRVLAVADRHLVHSDALHDGQVEKLVFRGFLALTDPVRSTARESVASLMAAGVGVKMITGDHPLTAAAIAANLGLANPDDVVTGPELDEILDQDLGRRVTEASVFARVTPRQKARIVAALQQAGQVVGMTGDGANDAAAIRLADVGIALGENSTASARAAADLLVVDGRIETIVASVLEGRSLWSAVRDAVALLVGGNLGEIGFTLLAGLMDGKSPLNARQLLLVNLLTDTIPALAVALRRPHDIDPRELLGEGPESSLGDVLTRDIEWRAALTGGITTLFWTMNRVLGNQQKLPTISMLVLVGSQLCQTMLAGKGSREVVMSSLVALVAMGIIVQTPGLSRFFGCRPLGPLGWAQVVASLGISAGGAMALPWLERNSRRLLGQAGESLERLLEDEQPSEVHTPG